MEFLQYFGVWQYVGIGLALWVLFDLFNGSLYLHRSIVRKEEPGLYWFGMLLWSAVAAWCFIGMDYLIPL